MIGPVHPWTEKSRSEISTKIVKSISTWNVRVTPPTHRQHLAASSHVDVACCRTLFMTVDAGVGGGIGPHKQKTWYTRDAGTGQTVELWHWRGVSTRVNWHWVSHNTTPDTTTHINIVELLVPSLANPFPYPVSYLVPYPIWPSIFGHVT